MFDPLFNMYNSNAFVFREALFLCILVNMMVNCLKFGICTTCVPLQFRCICNLS